MTSELFHEILPAPHVVGRFEEIGALGGSVHLGVVAHGFVLEPGSGLRANVQLIGFVKNVVQG